MPNVALTIQSPDAKINLYVNNFNRNSIGIAANGIAVNALLTANLFNKTSAFNWGNNPFVAEPVGISLNTATASLGNTNSTGINIRNRYYNQLNGINAFNSTANIGWSDFYKDKYGIRATGSTISISGKSEVDQTTFRQNIYDINVGSTSLDVTKSKFEYCNFENITSISNVNGFELINIHNNDFNLSNHNFPDYEDFSGIDLERTSGTNPTSEIFRNIIDDNRINIADFGRANVSAIRVMGFEGTEDKMLIQKNEITAGAGGNAYPTAFVQIVLGTSPGFMLENNNIYSKNVGNAQNGYLNRFGFLFLDGNSSLTSAHLYVNSVLGNEDIPDYFNVHPDPVDPGTCAFHFINARAMDICSNITDNTLEGFHFLGDNDGSKFYLNKVLNHSIVGTPKSHGFLLQPTVFDNTNFVGKLGVQLCAGNTFSLSNYSPGFGAKFDAVNALNVNDNKFFVKINTPIQMPFPRLPVGTGTPDNPFWFEEFDCEEGPSPCINVKFVETDSARLIPNDQKLAQNNTIFTTIQHVEDWENKRILVKKLLEYPSLVTNTYLTDFYNAHINQSPGKFAQFENMLHTAIVIDPMQQIIADNLVRDINNLLHQVDSLDNTLTDTLAILNADTNFFNYRGLLLKSAFTKNNLLVDGRNDIQSLRASQLLLCEQFNNSLPSNEIYESNQKLLNQLEINHAKGLIPDSIDIVQLYAIANQCPDMAGRTRERALSWLPKNESMKFRSEEPYNIPCSREGKELSSAPPSVTLYPNPASDEVTVKCPFLSNGTIKIFDISGKEKINFPVTALEDTTVIPVSQLSAGSYFVTIICSGSVYQKKLLIVR